MKKPKLISTASHRNGICGAGFQVTLFQDVDRTTKVLIDFHNDENPQDGEYYAALQVDTLAAGALDAFRGDTYVDEIRAQARIAEKRKHREMKRRMNAPQSDDDAWWKANFPGD